MNEPKDQVASDAPESKAEATAPASSDSAPEAASSGSPEQSVEPEASASAAVSPVQAKSVDGGGRRWWRRTGVLIASVAALVVIVAGGFFAIGWFTSTRGDDGYHKATYEQADSDMQASGQESTPNGRESTPGRSQRDWKQHDDGQSGGRSGRTAPPSQNDQSSPRRDSTTL